MNALPRSDLTRATLLFGAIVIGLAAAYAASVAGPGAFRDPAQPYGIDRSAGFNAALILVLGYTVAAAWLGRRWTGAEFDRLRAAVEATEDEWSGWTERLRASGRASRMAAALGAACGVGVNLGARRLLGGSDPVWPGHVVWTWLLNPLEFALLGWLSYQGVTSSSVFREMGRRVRVRWARRDALAPFARVGLRQATLWLIGSSLALLLFFESDVPAVVIGVMVVTAGIGVASLVAPSLGVHERLRDAKRAELAWVRDEIERASRALRAGEGTRLPALLAWEAHVAAASEWPIDVRTLLRFGVFLLVPVGSWLGGALAERAFDTLLG